MIWINTIWNIAMMAYKLIVWDFAQMNQVTQPVGVEGLRIDTQLPMTEASRRADPQPTSASFSHFLEKPLLKPRGNHQRFCRLFIGVLALALNAMRIVATFVTTGFIKVGNRLDEITLRARFFGYTTASHGLFSYSENTVIRLRNGLPSVLEPFLFYHNVRRIKEATRAEVEKFAAENDLKISAKDTAQKAVLINPVR